MIEHVVARGSEHHNRHRAEFLGFMHLSNRCVDVVQIDHRRPFDA